MWNKKAKFSTYLYMIATNQALDYIDSNWNVLKDREFPLFINYFLDPGIRGILLVGVLSAAMSKSFLPYIILS